MKLGNWLAAVGCLGLGVVGAMSAPGCTATLSVGPCDGGCSVPSTGDDSGTPSTNEDSGVPGFSACNSCLYGQCIGAYSNCIQNADCLAAYQCATAPTCASDANCVGACVAKASQTGQNLYTALGLCDLVAECPGAGAAPACASICSPSASYCGTTPDNDSGTTTTPDAAPPDDSGTTSPDSGTDIDSGSTGTDAAPAQTCDQCQAANCASQIQACAPSTPCGQYNQCVLACQSAACTTQCQASNATGYTAATALGTCTSQNCASACQ